jgi:hypothetical protein
MFRTRSTVLRDSRLPYSATMLDVSDGRSVRIGSQRLGI